MCGGGTDLDRTITFQYDTGEAWQTNLKGRLAKISYKIGQGGASGGQEPAEDFFAYTAAGLITRKDFRMQRSSIWMGLMSTYGYDAEGRRTAMRYPTQGAVPALELEYRYDALSRLQRVATQGGGTVWADNAQYGVGGELTSLTWNNWTESRAYNALGQLTRQTIAGTSDIEYVFSATQNDGRITDRKDYITGEQVVYQYDALGRLINATTGATGPQWGYSYTFDGFSNLYRKDVTKGSVPTLLISVDPANNRINTTGFVYSGNGNLTNAPGGWSYTYDQSNRMVTAAGPSGNDYYSYDASNKRVYRRKPDGTETIFFWSAAGELLGDFALSGTTLTGGTLATQNIYFAGKLIRARDQGVVTDRLGSVVYRGTTRINYYPYGEEQPSVTANDNFKYGTYFRDNTTGLDYAQNRYFSGTLARFTTADPYQPSGGLANSGRWNRYNYVEGDPVNFNDPAGLDRITVITPPVTVTDTVAPLIPSALWSLIFESWYSTPDWTNRGEPKANMETLATREAAGIGPKTEPQQVDVNKIILKASADCLIEHPIVDALTVIGAAMAKLGDNNISTRGKFTDATRGTSFASSYLASKVEEWMEALDVSSPLKRHWAPTLNSWRSKTPSLGRALGRWVPIFGWGLVGLEYYLFTDCVSAKVEEAAMTFGQTQTTP